MGEEMLKLSSNSFNMELDGTDSELLELNWIANIKAEHVNIRHKQLQLRSPSPIPASSLPLVPRKRLSKWSMEEVSLVLQEFHKLYSANPYKKYQWKHFEVLPERIRERKADYGRSTSSTIHKLQSIAYSLQFNTIENNHLDLVDQYTVRHYLCAAFNVPLHYNLEPTRTSNHSHPPMYFHMPIVPMMAVASTGKRTHAEVLPDTSDEAEPLVKREAPPPSPPHLPVDSSELAIETSEPVIPTAPEAIPAPATSETPNSCANFTGTPSAAPLTRTIHPSYQELKGALVSVKGTLLQALLAIYQSKTLLALDSMERTSMENAAVLLLHHMGEIERLT